MLVFAMVFCEGRYKLGLNSGIGGTGVVVQTEIMRTIGGFGNSLVDDLDICMELTKRDYRIAFARDCVVYDEKPLTWSEAFKQRTRWFRGHFDVLFSRFQETIKRPHDLLYLLSPTVVIALWTSLALGVLYIIQIHIFKTVFITYYGITLKTLAILTTPYVIQFFIGAAKEEGKLRALKNTVLYVFPLYLWTFIWYLVMFKAISVKSWATTKTLHIGGGR
jgi:cellulose synthase/poly-beta-1,6-N-acetylglucosamine synthase-like glycosyltransferase